jgi:hypothetical protein
MKYLAALTVLALALSLGACDQADPNGPAPVVEKLYAPYLAKGGDTASALTTAPLTPSLKALIDKAGVYGNLLNEPVLDFDPITFSQDMQITNVQAGQQGPASGDKAVARATFDNFGKHQEVLYDMRREGGAWQIDNIRSGKDDLRAIIETNLKPAGDPAAMIAPVKAIYDKYAAPSVKGKAAPPLQSYAAVSTTLRPLLDQRDAEAARTDRDPLGFDPVVDGTAWEISNVAFEAASSAVIARFTNAGTPKTIVYDVSQENGAWVVDDIRSPGVWDARMKLNDAGIK